MSRTRSKGFGAALGFAAGVALAASMSSVASADLAGDGARAAKARALTFELSVNEANDVLKGADPSDSKLALERARAALYQGDCELAAGLLSKPPLLDAPDTKDLAMVARGCVRASAGSVVVEDKERGVWIRFQDDADQVLAPFMIDVAAKAREIFKTDLGTELPTPMRIELVRDQYGLSAMTGLPIESARTTGTVAIAKWGRVVLVSPRSAPRGYSYLDTLAHELSHLAQTRASADRAPLWLQEGVARIEETRWRPARPFDNSPSCDDLSAFGINQHIGPEIDQIGPSIAMLSSAVDAQVTYAKVQSFMRFWMRESGATGLPSLLTAMKDGSGDDVTKAIEKVSSGSFATWKQRWEKEITAHATALPDELNPTAAPSKTIGETRKRLRLGELLLARAERAPENGRIDRLAAKRELGAALDSAPREAVVRARFAEALFELGDGTGALALVENIGDVYGNDPLWWSLRSRLISAENESASNIALSVDPLEPIIACGSIDPAVVPADADRKALCLDARSRAPAY